MLTGNVIGAIIPATVRQYPCATVPVSMVSFIFDKSKMAISID